MFRIKHMKSQRNKTKMESISLLLATGEKSIGSYKKLEMAHSPYHAMEFLSRSWSPSTSDFLQIFPSQGKYEQDDEDDESTKSAEEMPRFVIKQDNIKMDFDIPKSRLSCKSLTGLLRSQKKKKKEEARLHTTQVHAALSLTQLAAAISGISSGLRRQNYSFQEINWIKQGGLDMCNVLSSAASLLTTVCAEAAESLGAHRWNIRAAISSGSAIQSPIDMIAVTATAATSLRGASLLKSRAMLDSLARIQDMLRVGAEICIILPSGYKECARVSMYLKNDHLMFSFRKKYFGGVLHFEKEYKVTNITQENAEHGQGKYSLCLTTNSGIIKLLFEDEMQS